MNPERSPFLRALISSSFFLSSCSKRRSADLITSLAEEYFPDLICSLMKSSKYSPNNIDVFLAITFFCIEYTKTWYKIEFFNQFYMKIIPYPRCGKILQ